MIKPLSINAPSILKREKGRMVWIQVDLNFPGSVPASSSMIVASSHFFKRKVLSNAENSYFFLLLLWETKLPALTNSSSLPCL